MFKTISASIVALAVLAGTVFYTPNPDNTPILGNSNLATLSSETLGTFRTRVNEFIGDANFNWTSSTAVLEVIGTVSSTQLRSPSSTITALYDAFGTKYSTSTGGSGTVTTSTAVTANYFPFWGSASALSGTSSLYASGTRVGVGTISPSTTLHVIGGLTITGVSDLQGITFTNATGTGNIQTATGIFTTSVSTTLASATNISFTNATGTNATITTLKDVSGNSYVTSTTSTLQIFVETETGVNDNGIWVADFAGTVVAVKAVNKTDSDTVTFNLGWGASRGTATTSLKKAFTAYQTVTATTTPSTLTINGSTTFAVGDVFRYFTSAASSTEVSISISVR